ncbi:MAG: STAS domain-containing protein [Victivallales bacterium]|nr:STAS domain-containing protein [Victivallales bacterium]
MTIEFKEKNGVTIGLMNGRLDSATSPGAENELTEKLSLVPELLLNLESVEYVSSAGLRVFLLLAKKSRLSGASLALCSLQPGVAAVFDISGFTTLFTLYDNESAAVSGMTQK